jgi:hypothetical protein
MKSMHSRIVHLAWTRFQRRQVSMSDSLGFEVKFFRLSFSIRWLKPFEYLIKSVQTLVFLFQCKPEEIWIQVPPVPLLNVVLLYKFIRNGQVRVVGDCHNSMLRRPWSVWPGAIAALNRCDLVLVHNEAVVDTVCNLGVKRELVSVLEDAPATFGGDVTFKGCVGARILFPASFSEDEPIDELIAAAKMASEITFSVTGNPERARGRFDLSKLPSNVELTGYLPLAEFERRLLEADVILALTRHEGIQLSVCNEAVGAAKPMVLSDTAILRRLFGAVAVMIDSSRPHEIACGCRDAIARAPELSRKTAEFRAIRRRSWEDGQARSVIKRLRR